jgi:hypothetical protein
MDGVNAAPSLQRGGQSSDGRLTWPVGSIGYRPDSNQAVAVGFLPAPHDMKLRSRPSLIPEAVVGRSLAACVHPVAAWRSKSNAFRLQLVFGYAIAGYVLMMLALLLVGASAPR